MNDTAQARRLRNQPGTGLVYGWLLAALFLEYARPASFFSFLNIPAIYSAFPLLLFVVSLFAPGLRPPQEAFADRVTKWVFILLGIVFVSMLIHRAYSIEKFTSVLGYVMLYFVIVRVVTTWQRVRGVCLALILAHLFLLAMNPSVVLNPGTRQYLLGATFLGDGNDYGLSLCILFPCALEFAQSRRKAWAKGLSYFLVIMILFAIVATQSRGATLGLGAVVFFMWLYSSRKLIGVIGIAMIALAILLYAPSAYFQRMGTISNFQSDGSAQGRIDAWKAGLGMGAQNPLLGVGAGHFGPRWGKTAHSTYVLAFGELGLPGFISVIALVIANLRAHMSLRRRILAKTGPPADESQVVTTRMLFLGTAAMIGFAVAGAFLSATYYPHLYILTGLMIASRTIAARETGVPQNDVPDEGRNVRGRNRLRMRAPANG